MTASGTAVAVGAPAFLGIAGGTWTAVGLATTLGNVALATVLNITTANAEAVRKGTQQFLDGANQKLMPGEKYTWSSSLSMVRTVWLMNQNAQQVHFHFHNCQNHAGFYFHFGGVDNTSFHNFQIL